MQDTVHFFPSQWLKWASTGFRYSNGPTMIFTRKITVELLPMCRYSSLNNYASFLSSFNVMSSYLIK